VGVIGWRRPLTRPFGPPSPSKGEGYDTRRAARKRTKRDSRKSALIHGTISVPMPRSV